MDEGYSLSARLLEFCCFAGGLIACCAAVLVLWLCYALLIELSSSTFGIVLSLLLGKKRRY